MIASRIECPKCKINFKIDSEVSYMRCLVCGNVVIDRRPAHITVVGVGDNWINVDIDGQIITYWKGSPHG